MNQALLDKIESGQFRKEPTNFAVGDSVRVHTKVVEGDKERIQIFSGVVMMIEMLYHLTLNAANGPVMKLFGTRVNTEGMTAWSIAVTVSPERN